MKERLRNLRLESGLTQKELALHIGSTDKSIWNYEKGLAAPPYEILIAYSKFFDVTADYLLGLEDDFGARVPAAPPAPMNDGLTEKERAMLTAFRNLLPETQDFVLRTAQSLSDTTSNKTLKK